MESVIQWWSLQCRGTIFPTSAVYNISPRVSTPAHACLARIRLLADSLYGRRIGEWGLAVCGGWHRTCHVERRQ